MSISEHNLSIIIVTIKSEQIIDRCLKSINNNLTDTNAIVEHEEVQKLFQSEVDKIMQDFSNYEQVKKFELLNQAFSLEKGEITPKMSIVRKEVEKNYIDIINKIYG